MKLNKQQYRRAASLLRPLVTEARNKLTVWMAQRKQLEELEDIADSLLHYQGEDEEFDEVLKKFTGSLIKFDLNDYPHIVPQSFNTLKTNDLCHKLYLNSPPKKSTPD